VLLGSVLKVNIMDPDTFVDTFVYIKDGRHKGRIGYCDDIDDDEITAFVYFGSPLIASEKKVPTKFLGPIDTNHLLNRHKAIEEEINFYTKKISPQKNISLLEEYTLIDNILMDRLVHAQFMTAHRKKKIFLSYSSKDKQFVRYLATDISNEGHTVWFDEWDILSGESIPREIAVGIEKCNFVLVVLSPNSVKSRWVENEWHAKYWSEIESKKIKVIPILYKKCKIPLLLRTKKYADFTNDYSFGLDNLLMALKKL
jgi:hypothetical protein